jgi:hypothetical protein
MLAVLGIAEEVFATAPHHEVVCIVLCSSTDSKEKAEKLARQGMECIEI